MSSGQNTGVIDSTLPSHPTEVHANSWMWGSVALVARVPASSITEPDGNLWWVPSNAADITWKMFCKDLQSETSEFLQNDAGNLHKASKSWFDKTSVGPHFLAMTADAKQALSGAPTFAFDNQKVISKLTGAGIRIAGISRSRSEAETGAGNAEYVALHLKLSKEALQTPGWVTSALHRPTRAGLLPGTNIDGKDLRAGVNNALRSAGLAVELNNGGALQSKDKQDPWGNIYTISTFIPQDKIPQCQKHWHGPSAMDNPAVRWAHALSIAQTATPKPTLSDWSDLGVSKAQVSLGPSIGWCSDRGMGIVAQSRPDGDPEHWIAETGHTVALAHSVFVDLAVLTMQQDEFLTQRAGHLANLAATGNLEDSAASLKRYKDIQKRFIEFHGKRWLQEIPGRESATRVLQAMQNVRMLEERIKHSLIEQKSIMDYLEANQRAEEEQVNRERAEQLREEAVKREKFSHRVNIFAFIFLPATLIFTVTGGLGIQLSTLWGTIWIGIAAVTTIGLIAWMKTEDGKRKKDRKRASGGASRSDESLPAVSKG
ncbi:hypothetical protein ACFQ4U_09190 [Micrococcus antarcticus]